MELPWFDKQHITSFLVFVLGVPVAFAIGGILILATGGDPRVAYYALFGGAFGSVQSISEVMVKASPLLLTGLAVTIAFRCRFFNIGAEGQLTMGALAVTLVGLTFEGMPSILLFPLTMAAGFLAGALWGAIPGLLKAKLKADEIIVTLMMNFVAILLVGHLVHRPMRDPTAWLPVSRPVTPSAQLPKILPGTRLHAGLLIALVFVPLIYALLQKTTLGYRIRAVGASPKVATYGGMSVSKNILIATAISGGLAGLAGMGEILGIHYRLKEGISMGYGYTGIIVALLGKLHPFGVLLAAIFFSALIIGAESMQRIAGVSVFLAGAIQALVVLCVLGFETLTRRKG